MGGIYKACDFYMLRTPLFPIEFYKDICFEKEETFYKAVEDLLKIKEIREAIKIGSSSLYDSLELSNNKVYSSLVKYLIRMSTRTTPYGLFSGIEVGQFNDFSNIQIEDRKYFKKRTRPDMEWLYSVVNKIEKNKDLVLGISVKKNDLVYKKGNRLENPYVSNLGLMDKKDGDVTTSIRWTKLLELVLANTQEYIEFGELINIVLEKYPNEEEEKVYRYLQNLLSYEYLLSELRPPLTEINPFTYVINKIESLPNGNELTQSLNNINDKIKEYNEQEIGEGIELLSDITTNMACLCEEAQNYLQTDMRISLKTNSLNKCVAKDIEKYCMMLQKIGVREFESESIKTYREEFVEKYGTNIEVRLTELLDEDMGLGSPAGYVTPMSRRNYPANIPPNKLQKIEKVIKNKIVEAKIKHHENIRLTEEDINKMMEGEPLLKDEELSPSIEFNAIISAKSCQDIDNGNYTLFIGPNYGASKAGKTFGRFIDILPEDKQVKIKETVYQREKEVIAGEYVMAEISEVLQYGRGNNVTINSNNVEYEISIATNPSNSKKVLKMDDIYIGVDENKFYIRSKELGKKLLITYHHMMNHKNGSNIARFLKDISYGYYLNLMEVAMMLEFKDEEYIPRLMYENTVVLPASWYIKKENFDIDTYENFKESFINWADENRLPRYIYQKEFDNRLMLDLQSPLHQKELYNIIKKSNETIILTETELGNQLDQLIIKDEKNNHYCSEIVIPLIRQPVKKEKSKSMIIQSLQTQSIIAQNNGKVSLQDKRRNLFLGDENWYYYKLYVTDTRTNELIGEFLYDFCEELVQEQLISKYFFLRYSDPKTHIRLRIKAQDNQEYYVQKRLKELINELSDKGLIYYFQIENYSRELERYGGVEIIDYAEDYFYADSQYVGQLIKAIREDEIDYENLQIGMMSIIAIMEQFGVSFEDQEKLFSSIIQKDQYRDYYKKNRKEYMKFADWEAICSREVGCALYPMLMKRQEKLARYRQAVDQQDKMGLLCNSKEAILLSITHMFCNRFMGDRNWENLVMAMIRHSLYDLKAYKRTVKKKRI